ncbi:hypothetical protein ABZ599_37425 [Streptomyces misionensis]|uniref:hypothetical protein n=1 Tax=Streptomyces misionensis TaxID=67331 RepID=UPI0033EEA183
MDALLLALRRWDVVDAGQLRAVLACPALRDGDGDGVAVGGTLRLPGPVGAFGSAHRTGP